MLRRYSPKCLGYVHGWVRGREIEQSSDWVERLVCAVMLQLLTPISLQDFAVSGIRFGTLYTENQEVACAVSSLCYFHGVCGPVQYKIAQLLRDRGESKVVAVVCRASVFTHYT